MKIPSREETGFCFYNNIPTLNSLLFTKKFEWVHCGGAKCNNNPKVILRKK